VSIDGRVASPNDAVSPLTGSRAAVMRIGAGLRRTERRLVRRGDGFDAEEVEVFDELDAMLVGAGDALIVETKQGAIEVPLARLELVFPTGPLAAVTLDRPLPEPLRHVVDETSADDGVVAYREQALSLGDAVKLEAWVDRGERHDAPLRVLSDRGPVVLHDRSLASTELDRLRGRGRWLPVGVVAALGLAVAVLVMREQRDRPASPAPALKLTDTEGRVFRPGKSANGQGELERISGPDIAEARPGSWYHIYWKLDRAVGVCDVEWRKVDNATYVGTPEWDLCRAFVCTTDADCPPVGASVRCASGFCVQPEKPIGYFDYAMLCRAGTGVGATTPLASEEAFGASCSSGGPGCRLPSACPQL
jgi:hypothetical protein